MNDLIQTIGVIAVVTTAVVYLVLKFIWNPFKKKHSSGCDDNCNC